MNLRTFCLLVLVLAGLGRASSATIFVSPKGDDDGNGSTEHPFATLPRARDAARELISKGEVIEIILRGGTYELAEPLVLCKGDSGRKSSPVIWRSADGEEVRISGGRSIRGWRKVTDPAVLEQLDPAARGRILEINLKDLGITDYGEMNGGFGKIGSTGIEVFLEDAPMPISRYPNEGFITITEVLGPTPRDVRGTKGTNEGIFRVADPRIAKWTKEKDPRVLGYWFWDWAEERQEIASIDPQNLTVTLRQPWHDSGYRKDQYFYAYNLLSEIDRPGEWYLDRETGILYILPPGDKVPDRTMVSVLPAILSVQDASHVTFLDLIFEGAREHGVLVNDSAAVTLSACTIRNCGKWAVRIRGGKDCVVRGCDISGTGDGGILLQGGDRTTLSPANHLAENCHIHHYSRWNRTYQPAIRLEGVGCRAAHNLIHDAPHQAMSIEGNDHVIEFNEIHNVCEETNDAGAIYGWNDWAARGNIIHHNYLHHIYGRNSQGAKGIYLDDNFSAASIFGNVFAVVSQPVFLGGGRDIPVKNNLFVDCFYAIHIDARGLDWRKYGFEELKAKLELWPYQKAPWSERFPELLTLLDNEPLAPMGIVVARNIMISTEWDDIQEKARPYVRLEDNLFNAPESLLTNQPGEIPRVDERAREVWAIKFEPIPWKKIGLFSDKERASWPVLHPITEQVWAKEVTMSLRSHPRPPARVSRAAETPVIDGVIPPGEYPGGSEIMEETPDRKNIKNPPATMWLAHDDKRLYIAVSVPVKAPAASEARPKWGESEGVELAFSADKRSAPIFILRGFLDGTTTSSQEGGASAGKTDAVQKNTKFAAQSGPQAWTAEWSVPLDAAGIEVLPDSRLRFNLTARRAETDDWIVWTGTGRESWQLKGSGRIILE